MIQSTLYKSKQLSTENHVPPAHALLPQTQYQRQVSAACYHLHCHTLLGQTSFQALTTGSHGSDCSFCSQVTQYYFTAYLYSKMNAAVPTNNTEVTSIQENKN